MSHRITLDEGKKMIKKYKEHKGKMKHPDFPSAELPTCESFNRGDIDLLLAQTDCKKIRIYYSMDDKNDVRAILVGVNSKNEDIVGLQFDGKSDGTDGIILDRSERCPIDCPPTSPLNP